MHVPDQRRGAELLDTLLMRCLLAVTPTPALRVVQVFVRLTASLPANVNGAAKTRSYGLENLERPFRSLLGTHLRSWPYGRLATFLDLRE